jgi:hypothetical protein
LWRIGSGEEVDGEVVVLRDERRIAEKIATDVPGSNEAVASIIRSYSYFIALIEIKHPVNWLTVVLDNIT